MHTLTKWILSGRSILPRSRLCCSKLNVSLEQKKASKHRIPDEAYLGLGTKIRQQYQVKLVIESISRIKNKLVLDMLRGSGGLWEWKIYFWMIFQNRGWKDQRFNENFFWWRFIWIFLFRNSVYFLKSGALLDGCFVDGWDSGKPLLQIQWLPTFHFGSGLNLERVLNFPLIYGVGKSDFCNPLDFHIQNSTLAIWLVLHTMRKNFICSCFSFNYCWSVTRIIRRLPKSMGRRRKTLLFWGRMSDLKLAPRG